jgi:hypothetical protein
MQQQAIFQGFLAIAALAGGLFLFFSAFRRLALRRAVEDTPTSKARSAALGRVELKGRCRGPALKAPFSGLDCVWCRIKVEEERTETDLRGRRSRSWVTLHESVRAPLFTLDDGTGEIQVDPQGAEVDAVETLSWTSGWLQAKALPPGPEAFQWATGGKRRLTEWGLLKDAPLYALGVLREPAAGEGEKPAPRLMRGRNGEPFYLSSRDEQSILSSLLGAVMARLVLGAALALGSLAFLAWRLSAWH